jgi:hypothetical protein
MLLVPVLGREALEVALGAMELGAWLVPASGETELAMEWATRSVTMLVIGLAERCIS